jgi:hypothetical protein
LAGTAVCATEAVQNVTKRNANTKGYFFTPANVEIVIDICDYFIDNIPVRFSFGKVQIKKLRALQPEVFSKSLIIISKETPLPT